MDRLASWNPEPCSWVGGLQEGRWTWTSTWHLKSDLGVLPLAEPLLVRDERHGWQIRDAERCTISAARLARACAGFLGRLVQNDAFTWNSHRLKSEILECVHCFSSVKDIRFLVRPLLEKSKQVSVDQIDLITNLLEAVWWVPFSGHPKWGSLDQLVVLFFGGLCCWVHAKVKDELLVLSDKYSKQEARPLEREPSCSSTCTQMGVVTV